jgi:uncharacterized protein YxeA
MRNSLKKTKKRGKILLAIIIILIIAVVIIVIVRKNKNQTSEEPVVEETKQEVYSLPDTTYRDMEVVGITTEYLNEVYDGKAQNQTKVRMRFKNVTTQKIENEDLEVYLINSDDDVIGNLETSISKLAPGEEYDMEVILSGDLTSATQIKLEKKD